MLSGTLKKPDTKTSLIHTFRTIEAHLEVCRQTKNLHGSYHKTSAYGVVDETLEVLPLLTGGAKLTSHLTDVTPKLIILSVLDGGNHPFMNVMVEQDGQGKLSIPALRQVIADYENRFLDSIYIGRREGFMDELDEPLRQLAAEGLVIYDSPNQVVAQLVGELSKHFGGE